MVVGVSMALYRISDVQKTERVFEVIADKFMSREVILLKLLALISLKVFSNLGSGSIFSDSKLLLIQSGSKFSSKDVIADGFVAEEAILFRLSSFLSLILFSNVGSGSNFADSKLLYVLSGKNSIKGCDI